MTDRLNYSIIIRDNESAAREAFERGDYVQTFLLLHALIESLLRNFLNVSEEKYNFSKLIEKYEKFLIDQNYREKTLIKEFTSFNRRRNRIIHELWRKGYTYTNRHSEPAASAALIIYGLAIEFLETWDDEITKLGFQIEQPSPHQ